MSKKTQAEMPKVELATQDWVVKELMDTERRIEKAFHQQTQFLTQKTDGIQKANDDLKKEIMGQTRWMVGLAAAIIIAVLFKS